MGRGRIRAWPLAAVLVACCGDEAQEPPVALVPEPAHYFPVPDPLPMRIVVNDGTRITPSQILKWLPVTRFSLDLNAAHASGSASIEPVSVGLEGQRSTVSFDLAYCETRLAGLMYPHAAPLPSGTRDLIVYFGVGVRITMNLSVVSGRVALADVGSIKAALDAGRVTGSISCTSFGTKRMPSGLSGALTSESITEVLRSAELLLRELPDAARDGESVEMRIFGIDYRGHELTSARELEAWIRRNQPNLLFGR